MYTQMCPKIDLVVVVVETIDSRGHTVIGSIRTRGFSAVRIRFTLAYQTVVRIFIHAFQ